MLTDKKGIAIIVVCVIVLVCGLVWFFQMKSLKNKITELEKTVDNQDQTIVQLAQELELTKFELLTVQKSLSVLEEFTQKEKEIHENEEATKSNILQVVTQSEESRGWWSSDIPTDLLDAFVCE